MSRCRAGSTPKVALKKRLSPVAEAVHQEWAMMTLHFALGIIYEFLLMQVKEQCPNNHNKMSQNIRRSWESGKQHSEPEKEEFLVDSLERSR
jgi:hypothetical protein